MATLEFIDYALIWWDQLNISRRHSGEGPVTTWREMKAFMRKRFVPAHYHRDILQKLQSLKQGNKSVEDYFKEMEISMICANINEDREATMARFLARLNIDIADVLELQHYVELEDMMHMAIKIERKNKRKPYKSNPTASSSQWNFENPKKILPISKESLPKPKQTFVEVNKTKPMDNHERTRDIRCFKCLKRGHISSQCPNKNAMLVLDNGDIMFGHEEEEKEVPSPPKEEN
ncbi:hypothetical protein GQ457_01G017200 [Hibiscus cannabinus]